MAGKYIKDLSEIETADDSCDLVIEDSTPETMRIKLGDLKEYINQEVSTQINNLLNTTSTQSTDIATLQSDITDLNNSLSELENGLNVSQYTLSSSYFSNVNAYKFGRVCMVCNDENQTKKTLSKEDGWTNDIILPTELYPQRNTYQYFVSQSNVFYELEFLASGTMSMIARSGDLDSNVRAPFTICYLTAT